MGYTTDFTGKFTVTPALKPEHREYLAAFNETRRMKRSVTEALKLEDPARAATNLSAGTEAGYFVGGAGYKGQDQDASIVDYNRPPAGQPGLWCQWTPNKGGTAIQWDKGEKFYNYTEWLQYLITHFLKPWGYTLNGDVKWRGEDSSDRGTITVKDNIITTK